MRKAKIKKKFDGEALPVNMKMIRDNIPHHANFGIQLYPTDKIVRLNIPHGELYHKCTDEEWKEILEYIEENIGIEEPFFARLKKGIKKLFDK